MKKITVYTTTWCSFCNAAKALLKQRSVAYEEVSVLDSDDNTWDQLYEKSGMRTVPQIFVDGEILGGYQELRELDQQDQLASLKS